MKLSSLLSAALLAGVLASAAFAETSKKPRSKSTDEVASPTPRPKSTKTEGAEERGDATPKPRKKSGAVSTPKATPKVSSDPEADDAETATATKSSKAKALTATPAPTDEAITKAATSAPERAPSATLDPTELREFAAQPPRIQQLIGAALELTKLNLTYTYGSADPTKGGMDCSGTMYYLLRAQGFSDVPRDSSSQYSWARKRGPFFAVVSKSGESFEFDDLQPGDLLFWTGTYQVQREIPISHVMLYLGTEKKTKKRVMFGASDGRSYAGIQRWGVSVFDFKMPREGVANGSGTNVDFVGYGRIPGLRDGVALTAATPAETDAATNAPPPEPPQKKALPPAKTEKSGSPKRPKKSAPAD